MVRKRLPLESGSNDSFQPEVSQMLLAFSVSQIGLATIAGLSMAISIAVPVSYTHLTLPTKRIV